MPMPRFLSLSHVLAAILCLIAMNTAALAASDRAADNPVPIPPGECGLTTRTAELVTLVPHVKKDLEGPVFDSTGRLVFSDTQGQRLLSWTPDAGLNSLARFDDLLPGGLAIHDDRIYVAAFTADSQGTIVSLNLNGDDRQTIVATGAGYLPNDLVFDHEGGFYFTDSHAGVENPKGGVYYRQPDSGDITPVLQRLNIANGLALAPGGQRLWVGEFGDNRLHRLNLDSATDIASFGALVAYNFIGPAPDSMRIDTAGHVYVAMYGQGRILVFTRLGLPMGQIVLPKRASGRFLNVTSMAIKPGTETLYIVASDGDQPPGQAGLLRTKAFGPSFPLPEDESGD